MIVYGMAFDFFNISGSLFVEQETSSNIRASAQGLFFMMTNGLGAIIGGYASGAVVDAFSVYADGKLVSREWPEIWLILLLTHWSSVYCSPWCSSTSTGRKKQ